MKHAFTIFCICTAAAAQAADWTRPPLDKAAHIGLGGALSLVVSHHLDSPLAGIAAAAAVGVVKEASDRRFDTGDLASWIAGGVAGAALSQHLQHLAITPAGVAWRQHF